MLAQRGYRPTTSGDCGNVFPGVARVLFRVLGLPADNGEGVATLWRYTAELVTSRAEEPLDDVTTDLIQARDGDVPAPSAQGVATNVFGRLLAGHETTTNWLGNVFRCLLSLRWVGRDVCAYASCIPNVHEWVLRFDASVMASRRGTHRTFDVNGVTMPAEVDQLLLLGLANRDREVFPVPDHLAIGRSNAKEQLSIGHMVHQCLGTIRPVWRREWCLRN